MKRIPPYLRAFPALMCRMALACLLSAVVTACVRDRIDAELPPVPAQPEQVEVKIHLRANRPASPTRTMTPEQENKINDVYVFFLNKADNDRVHSVVKGKNVEQNSTEPEKWTFTASLSVSSGATATFDCMVLTNVEGWMSRQNLPGFIGMDYDALQKALVSDVLKPAPGSSAGLPGSVPTDGLVMWGKGLAPVSVPVATASITVPVIRALASVEVGVGVGPKLENVDSWTGWDGNDASGNGIPFVLKKVYVYRPNKQYAFMPRWDAYVSDDRKVNAPSPAGESAAIESPFEYTLPEGAHGIRGQIYLPEADIKQIISGDPNHTGKPGDAGHTSRCALVVCGSYDGHADSYYRIDFNDNAAGRSLIDLLRNHRYYVTITSVHSDGEDSAKEAYESLRVNLGIEITNWTDNFQDVHFDGDNWMYAAQKHITLPGAKGFTGSIAMESSIDPAEWEMSFVESDGGTTLPDKSPSVQNTFFRVTKPATATGGKLTITTLGENMTDNEPDRTATLTIKARGLTFKISIIQKPGKHADWQGGGEYHPTLQ